jgi:hypothetical protein
MARMTSLVTYQVKEDIHFKLERWRLALEQEWGRGVTRWELIDFLVDTIGPPTHTNSFRVMEVVEFDPKDYDTYPSVCVDPHEVRDRFGFVGGERLLFTQAGSYIGQLINELEEPQ